MSHMISDSEMQAALSGLPGWSVEDGQLAKTYTFPSFRDAVAAVVRTSFEVEDTNHHPDISISFRMVGFRLCTHDAGDEITDKDLRLAALIENLIGDSEAE